MKRSCVTNSLIFACGFITTICFFLWPPFPGDDEAIFEFREENRSNWKINKNESPSAVVNEHKNPHQVKVKVENRKPEKWRKVKPEVNLYPRPWRIVDIKIQYIINNPICGGIRKKPEEKKESRKFHDFSPESDTNGNENEDGVFIINLVHTHALHFQVRQMIRDSFTQEDLKSVSMRRVFLLANPDRNQFHQGNLDQINTKRNNSASNKTLVDFWSKVTEENSRHSDLVMGDFMENYRNLTYKHLMGLDWASRFCPQANFIIKQDDDTAVDFYQVKNLLDFATKSHKNSSLASSVAPEKIDLARQLRDKLSESAEGAKKDRRFFMGRNRTDASPEREKNRKWAVTKQEHAGAIYPNFLLGWFYLTTMESARDILKVAKMPSAGFFWIDDVFVTGILREKAGIEIISSEEFGSLIPEEFAYCLDLMNGVVTKEESLAKDATLLKREEKGFWCKKLAVMLQSQFLSFLKAFHKEARWCHRTLRCGSS